VAAGHSARVEAERAQARAKELERELAALRARADAFSKGAEGEGIAAEALGALSAHGWHLLHDRQVPGLGGNVDHVAVGPGGVVVLNAKHWEAAVFRGGALWAGRHNCAKDVERLEKERFSISMLLKEVLPDARGAASALVFTKGFEGTPAGVRALTTQDLRAHFLEMPAVLTPTQAERVFSHLMARTYPAGVKVDAVTEADFAREAKERGMGDVDELEERYTRVYLRDWSKGSLRRLYATDGAGAKMGWRDQVSGEVTLEEACSAPRTARAVLQVGAPKGLAKVEVPEVAVGKGLGKRVFMAVAGVRRSVLVGWYWSRSGKHRLYVHLLDHKKKPVELGYVDLDTGEVSVTTAISDRRSSSEHLLRYAWTGAR
jgi:hypothetical protein